MQIIAYTYTNPLIESPPDPNIWGWEIDHLYQDIGNRIQLEQLLIDTQTTHPEETYLLIRHYQELGDNIKQINQTLNLLQQLNIIIIAINSPEHQTPLELFQNIQTQQRSRQIRQAHAQNRIKAIPPPGKAPFGYRRTKDRYLIDRTTSLIVKDFFDQFLLFGSLRGAVRHLEKRYNKKISVATGKNWLTNPVYRGDLKYHNNQIISDTHPAIISREEAAQIDRLLKRNQRFPKRLASVPRSLSGLVFCQECQSPMKIIEVTTYKQKKKYLYLIPKTCPKKPKCHAIPYQEILQETINLICQDLSLAVQNLNLSYLEKAKENINNQILKAQSILAQLPDLTNSGILDQESETFRAYQLRTQISQLRTQLAQFPPINLLQVTQVVSIPRFWLDLSESERRFYLREFLQKIEIIPLDNQWKLNLIFIFNN